MSSPKMSLEERLRTIIKHGQLLHLSLHKNFDNENWSAGYMNTDNHNVRYVEDPDPIRALEKAMVPLRQPKPKPVELPVARRVRKQKTRRGDDLI